MHNILSIVCYAFHLMNCILCSLTNVLYSMHHIILFVFYILYFINCMTSIVIYVSSSILCILCIVVYALYYIHWFHWLNCILVNALHYIHCILSISLKEFYTMQFDQSFVLYALYFTNFSVCIVFC